jgi:hypothetical protein
MDIYVTLPGGLYLYNAESNMLKQINKVIILAQTVGVPQK